MVTTLTRLAAKICHLTARLIRDSQAPGLRDNPNFFQTLKNIEAYARSYKILKSINTHISKYLISLISTNNENIKRNFQIMFWTEIWYKTRLVCNISVYQDKHLMIQFSKTKKEGTYCLTFVLFRFSSKTSVKIV